MWTDGGQIRVTKMDGVGRAAGECRLRDFSRDEAAAIKAAARMREDCSALGCRMPALPVTCTCSGQLGCGKGLQLCLGSIQGVEQRARRLLRLGALGQGEGGLHQAPRKGEGGAGGAGGAGQGDAAALHDLVAAGQEEG